MNSLKLICIAVYFYTSLLPVHAFAMHSVHDTSGQHQEVTQNCGHSQPGHDHTSHSEKDTEHTDMSECIDQGKGTVTDDTVIFSSHTYIPYVLPFITYIQDIPCNEMYTYSLHDPGRGDNAAFTKFLMSHYGQTILHC